MKSEKKDLRIVKTEKVLFEALIDLMKDKTFEEIKVSDICHKALVNRSTFYAHYNDKYELLETCIQDLKESLIVELNNNKEYKTLKEYYLEMIRLFLNHIEERKDLYKSILINNRNSIMMDILYDVVDSNITNEIKKDKSNIVSDVPSEVISKFYLGAVFNVSIEWLKDSSKMSKQDIIKYLDILIPNDITTFKK